MISSPFLRVNFVAALLIGNACTVFAHCNDESYASQGSNYSRSCWDSSSLDDQGTSLTFLSFLTADRILSSLTSEGLTSEDPEYTALDRMRVYMAEGNIEYIYLELKSEEKSLEQDIDCYFGIMDDKKISDQIILMIAPSFVRPPKSCQSIKSFISREVERMAAAAALREVYEEAGNSITQEAALEYIDTTTAVTIDVLYGGGRMVQYTRIYDWKSYPELMKTKIQSAEFSNSEKSWENSVNINSVEFALNYSTSNKDSFEVLVSELQEVPRDKDSDVEFTLYSKDDSEKLSQRSDVEVIKYGRVQIPEDELKIVLTAAQLEVSKRLSNLTELISLYGVEGAN